MKQASKKASNIKVPVSKAANTAKQNEAVKADSPLLQKTNQFHRFLEASCDCV